LTDIVVVLIVQGERDYRQSALSHYEWVLKRRQEMRDKIQRKLEERERLKQEYRIRREKQRIRGLLRQAMDFRKASDIRGFVEHIRVLHHVAETEPSDFLVWTNWASEQADKIDPLKNGQLLAHMKEAMDDDEIEFFDNEDEDDEIEG
jgi:heme-degrading monooxygenase HmoA